MAVRRHSVTVPVSYDLPVELNVAAGDYDRTSLNLEEANYPTVRRGEVEVTLTLINFGCPMSTVKVWEALRSEGLAPRGPQELVAVGNERQELLQELELEQVQLVELETIWLKWDAVPYAATLRYVAGVRILNLPETHPETEWRAEDWFIAAEES